jgi:hypothetical protein
VLLTGWADFRTRKPNANAPSRRRTPTTIAIITKIRLPLFPDVEVEAGLSLVELSFGPVEVGILGAGLGAVVDGFGCGSSTGVEIGNPLPPPPIPGSVGTGCGSLGGVFGGVKPGFVFGGCVVPGGGNTGGFTGGRPPEELINLTPQLGQVDCEGGMGVVVVPSEARHRLHDHW